METQTTETLMLRPEELLNESNIRFGLKLSRIAVLADSITRLGRVHTNLKVEELAEPGPNGEKYLIREGHYRQAAATLLNKQGAGILLPCTVEDALEGVERLKYQISENLDRENMSPMDMAVAIKELVDCNTSKVEIRQMFPRGGGRKGLAVQPLSNAMLNIYLSFLEFPKKIQTLIHDGVLGVGDAYKLSKRPKSDWDAIVAEAEAERAKESEAEDKLESQYLDAEKKAAEAQARLDAQKKELEEAEKAVITAKQAAKAKALEAVEANNATLTAESPEAKEKAKLAAKAKKAEAEAADRAAAKAAADAAKLAEKAGKHVAEVAERRKKLEAARKEQEKKGKKKLDTEKATDKLDNALKALNSHEIKEMINMLKLPGSPSKVQRIGVALERCFYGVEGRMSTDGELLAELSWVTGERKEKPKHLK